MAVSLVFLLPHLPTRARAYFIVNSCIIHSLHTLSKTPDSNKSDRIICKGREPSGNFSFFFPSSTRNKTFSLEVVRCSFLIYFLNLNLSTQTRALKWRTTVHGQSAHKHISKEDFRRRQMNLSGVGGERPKWGQQQLKMCCSRKEAAD